MTRASELIAYLLASVAIFTVWACGSNGDDTATIPRREAFARPVLYAKEYRPLPDSIPLVMEINAYPALEIERRNGGIYWITQHYTAYGIDVYYTLTPARGQDKATAAWQRSMQRMSDNIGGMPVRHVSATSPSGFQHDLTIASDINPFPVQFVSTDRRNWIVSAAATYTGGKLPASYDSIYPVLKALEQDIAHTLNTMDHAKN